MYGDAADTEKAYHALLRDLATVDETPPPASVADAELIQLGEELEGLLEERTILASRLSSAMQIAHAEAARRIEAEPGADKEQKEAIFIECERAGDVKALKDDFRPIVARFDAITTRLRELRATTLAGLRAKVALAIYWRDPDVDSDEIDQLLIDLATLTRVSLPPAFGFDPRYWLGRYRSNGGDALRSDEGGLYLAYPTNPADESRALEEEIAGHRAKWEAVRDAARAMEQGIHPRALKERVTQAAERQAERAAA